MMFPESKIKEQTNKTYIRSFVQSPVHSGSLKKRKGTLIMFPVSKNNEIKRTKLIFVRLFKIPIDRPCPFVRVR